MPGRAGSLGAEIDDADEADKKDTDEGYGGAVELFVNGLGRGLRLGRRKRGHEVKGPFGGPKETCPRSFPRWVALIRAAFSSFRHSLMADAGKSRSSFPYYPPYFFLAGFFKGTSADQDRRFSDKELKLLKSIKFPPQFDTKVFTSTFSSTSI